MESDIDGVGAQPPSFERLFRQATREAEQGREGMDPYPYQVRLATMGEWPDVLRVPTGAGKTQAAVLAWLWRRRYHPDLEVRRQTPRRLVYVLPMRTLVEQTTTVIRRCLANLSLGQDGAGAGIGVHVLMGGADAEAWTLYPEREAILVGTQDMLLSRALNRGYAESRFAWPLHYGLLNTDVLWVADEVQLMGSGLATTVQLDHFRRVLGTVGPTRTLWMSATITSEWLQTVDSTRELEVSGLHGDDRGHAVLQPRLVAAKMLRKLDVPAENPKLLATRVQDVHQQGTRTLIVCNTVERARQLYKALAAAYAAASTGGASTPELLLIHSRFRPAERRKLNEQVSAAVGASGPGIVVVATQVVEAGVDMSARVLITEVAPWASLVQRFGRCNRYGEYTECAVLWVDLSDPRHAPPYDLADLAEAHSALEAREGASVSPTALETGAPDLRHNTRHVLRRRDVLDLFDTMPDLAGADIDMGRFVRDGDERDVQVFWRDLPVESKDWGALPRAERDELCAAPIEEVRKLAERLRAAGGLLQLYHWDFLDRRWTVVRGSDLRPGMVVLAPRDAGGYDMTLGWDMASTMWVDTPHTLAINRDPEEGTDDDPLSAAAPGRWQTLAGHTGRSRPDGRDTRGAA